ncbi:hypothetical protein IAR55_001916 [Kwoniella newhampshirensis]|uniref:Uncharacterized protein n=1 Tax=Kwoniella newhampshirensis TaxID=1651941 RepID=A0AAW0Z3H7_9TREE
MAHFGKSKEGDLSNTTQDSSLGSALSPQPSERGATGSHAISSALSSILSFGGSSRRTTAANQQTSKVAGDEPDLSLTTDAYGLPRFPRTHPRILIQDWLRTPMIPDQSRLHREASASLDAAYLDESYERPVYITLRASRINVGTPREAVRIEYCPALGGGSEYALNTYSQMSGKQTQSIIRANRFADELRRDAGRSSLPDLFDKPDEAASRVIEVAKRAAKAIQSRSSKGAETYPDVQVIVINKSDEGSTPHE